MFEDCGEKLKGFAIGYFILGCIASVIGGIALMASDAFFLGLGVMLGGILTAYLTSLVIAAFGDLVTATEATARNTRELLQKNEQPKESFYKKSGVPTYASTGAGQASEHVPTWKRVQMESEE